MKLQFCVIAILYIAWSLMLSTPYHPFPSDDLRFYGYLNGMVTLGFNLGFGFLLYLFRPLVGWLGMSTMPVVMILFNLASAWLVFRIARPLMSQCWIPVVVFLASSWVTTYTLLIFTAPVLAFCFLACWALGGSPKDSPIAGILVAVLTLLGTSCSISFLAAVPAMVIRMWRCRYSYLLALAAGLSVLYLIAGQSFQQHVTENVQSPHLFYATAKFGFVPGPPPLSGLFCLYFHSPFVLIGFLASTLIAVLVRLSRESISKDTDLWIILLAIWVSMVIVDLLPTTKLARAHFFWFPLLCVFVVASVSRWMGVKWMRLVAIPAVAIGLIQSHSLSRDRWALHREIGSKPYVLLQNDPHAIFLSQAMNRPPAHQVTNGVWVVAGPSGPKSGTSILMAGLLPDFTYDGPISRQIPYYSTRREFCLEEEVCQGLLWRGLMPKESQLHVFQIR
jgi:hypothetical protein